MEADSLEVLPDGENEPRHPPSREPAPDADLQTREDCDRLRRGLQVRDFYALWRLHVDDDTQRAVAEGFGVSNHTAREIGDRAMERARRVLCGGLGKVGVA